MVKNKVEEIKGNRGLTVSWHVHLFCVLGSIIKWQNNNTSTQNGIGSQVQWLNIQQPPLTFTSQLLHRPGQTTGRSIWKFKRDPVNERLNRLDWTPRPEQGYNMESLLLWQSKNWGSACVSEIGVLKWRKGRRANQAVQSVLIIWTQNSPYTPSPLTVCRSFIHCARSPWNEESLF